MSRDPNESQAPGAVLIVEDDRINRLLLQRHVERMGRRVLVADHGRAALDILQSDRCDLVLLDVMMPEMDGQEVLLRMKDRADLRNIPVVVISGLSETDTAAKCIEFGAEDFLTKPFNPAILQARINASLEKKQLRDQEAAYVRRLLELQERLDRRNRELEVLNQQLAKAALTDVLTGLPNRRAAMEELHRCWAASSRHSRPMACLLVDIDHFKRVNDNFGHDVGDDVLRAVAGRLRAAARLNETVCRLGGEEFIVLAEFCDRDEAVRCGERLRTTVASGPVVVGDSTHSVTVSIGAAVRGPSEQHAEQLLKAADRAVYAAKDAGRDRVMLAQ